MNTKEISARIAIVALFLMLLVTACNVTGSNESSIGSDLTYLPQAGDIAVIFTHRFNEGDYEAGKQIVVDGFSEAIEASGQTRRTYFLENRAESELIAISYFHPDSSTEAWLASAERAEVLALLGPLYREPLMVDQLIVEEVHDTP